MYKEKLVEHEELVSIRNGVEADYDLTNPNSARAIKEAEDNSLEVVFPNEYQLQIDIDTEHAYQVYLQMYPIVEKYYGIAKMKETESRSGLPKRHITLTLYQTVSSFERIALQVALGSDRVREILSVVQERQGDPHPTLFLEKKTVDDANKELMEDLFIGGDQSSSLIGE